MDIKVEVEGIAHNGVSKNNNPYFILTCYAFLPGFKHPVATEFFCDKPLSPRMYTAPLSFQISGRDKTFDVDLKAAQPVKVASAA